MAKTLIGDFCADLGPRDYGEGRDYKKIGVAFRDEQGRISVKIDTLPLPGSNWKGWCNLFEESNRSAKAKSSPDSYKDPRPKPDPMPMDVDDDIPF